MFVWAPRAYDAGWTKSGETVLRRDEQYQREVYLDCLPTPGSADHVPLETLRSVAVIAPILASERIRTGRWRQSSLYQMVIWLLASSRKMPAASMCGSTTRQLNVPAGVCSDSLRIT